MARDHDFATARYRCRRRLSTSMCARAGVFWQRRGAEERARQVTSSRTRAVILRPACGGVARLRRFRTARFHAAIDALQRSPANSNASAAAAQLDLVEFTLLKAYLGADALDDARRMVSLRRPGALGIPLRVAPVP